MKQELSRLLGTHSLPKERLEKILSFYEFLVQENSRQNLTRLIEPKDFYYGHFLDACEILKSGLLTFPVMDLGSGVGVPGLLAALISDGDWVLAESELRKADYLQRAVQTLGLEAQVKVAPGRAEEYLKKNRVSTVTARAVGPVERIYGWIANCSTWNNLVLMKGPGWEEEWKRFQSSKYRNQLRISDEYRYQVGPEEKTRIIVKLIRLSNK